MYDCRYCDVKTPSLIQNLKHQQFRRHFLEIFHNKCNGSSLPKRNEISQYIYIKITIHML